MDPTTRAEWQEAADQAWALLVLDAARAYGLVVGGPVVNVPRAEDLIRRAKGRGVEPRKRRALRELVAECRR